MYLHGGMPHLNHEKALSLVARNDLIMTKPFWLELAGKTSEKSWLQQLSRRGKFCMRGMHGMRGLPRSMRGGWQVCSVYLQQRVQLHSIPSVPISKPEIGFCCRACLWTPLAMDGQYEL